MNKDSWDKAMTSIGTTGVLSVVNPINKGQRILKNGSCCYFSQLQAVTSCLCTHFNLLGCLLWGNSNYSSMVTKLDSPLFIDIVWES